MMQRNPTHPFLIAPLCLAALLLGLTCAPASANEHCDANAKLTVGSARALSGLVEVELRGSSLCDVTGFGLAIGHDGTQVEFVESRPGPFLEAFGTDLEYLDDWNDEFIVILAFWIGVAPASIDENELLATLTYRILPGVPLDTVVELRNETRTFGNPNFLTANIFTSDGPQIEPELESGTITIGEPEFYSMGLDATVDSEIALQLTGSSSKPLRAFSASLTFDPSIFAVVSVDPGKLSDEAFAGTVWEGSLITDVTLGDGTIAIQAFRRSAVAPGVDLPFLNLTLEILSCAGDTSIVFEDRGAAANQFVDDAFGTHDLTTDLAVEDITIPLGGSAGSGFVRGNANGGTIDPADTAASVDLADGIYILQHLFMGGQAPPCADAADANDDERLNILDPITVFQYLLGNAGSALPAPFEQPGDDPAGDALGCDTPPSTTCVEL